ncbi:SDR family NAD(P)-dependent oxidoreductase [Pseudenhygromyxa sp. WMMC2535]|uniref:SDR family NAD(P)-dependent oxidoreductase n=1 Tax=Pseudenhygromyxa sp. WMMC2535 TaxID=2712867 RepID=UPI0015576153|nr:SDR family NAD(P)-dependent oxidoreductase [Pseudenhygromyxa sp. WMMC2535]NVB36238.1 SDR family NAD(P)-dependent oxidoreductase [Pseudenhygromyxa sp. WMMC2535]NVB43426.1 SDR family NAD(P)-dependent oxidoreductase [Pseudenhygromyxa sp. WMMC2535]
MAHVLITGGKGFIGAAIARALIARGDKVTIWDVGRAPTDPTLAAARYREVDISDRATVEAAADATFAEAGGVDAVIHNASLVHTKQNHAEMVWSVNLEGTRHMLEATRSRGVGSFVYISSGSVVYEGRNIESGDERLPYAGSSQAPYADSKIAAEKLVLAQNGVDGQATCALRPHVVFGPGDTRFLPALLAQADAGRLRVRVGLGNWLSDYTYIDNLVDGVCLALDALRDKGVESVAAGQAYFITNGEPIPFWDLVRMVLAELDYPPILFAVPGKLVYAIAAIKEQVDALRGELTAEDGLTRFAIRYMCTHHYFSIDKARRELGYAPKVSIQRGVELTCADLRSRGELPQRRAS